MQARFVVESDQDGWTVAAVLRRHLALSWARAKRLCERGKVSLAGVLVTDPTTRVKRRQPVAVDEAAPTPDAGPRVQIVYEDPHVVVIDKPAGVSSVPFEKREQGTAMDLVREAWRKMGQRGQAKPLLVVHRIDKDTSGLLAFATSKVAERGLQALFREHAVERTYRCVVHGALKDMRIETRLVDDRGDGIRGSSRHPLQGKRAVTHLRVVELLRSASVCEVRLETGKTHQIRIHLAESGHPLVGETVYIRDYLRAGKEPLPSSRLLLHAQTLGFVHPLTGARVTLSAPLPPDFLAELERLR